MALETHILRLCPCPILRPGAMDIKAEPFWLMEPEWIPSLEDPLLHGAGVVALLKGN